jgi:hypothetical protein
MSGKTVCFQCGQSIGEVPQLHRLPSGESCRACAERALEAVPPALPAEPDPSRVVAEMHQGELFPETDEPA